MARSSVVVCALLLAPSAFPSAAQACSPGPLQGLEAPDGVYDMPLEGVLVLVSGPLWPDLLPVTVTDAAGAPVSGTVEGLVLVRSAPSFPGGFGDTRDLLVWRADAPLLPDADYHVEVTEHSITHTFVAHTRAEPHVAAPASRAPAVTVTPVVVSLRLAYHCEPDPGSSCPSCEYTDEVGAHLVRADLTPPTLDDFTLRRLVMEEGFTVIDRSARSWDGDGDGQVRLWVTDGDPPGPHSGETGRRHPRIPRPA